MSLIAIPNVSEGTDGQRIADLRWAASGSGAEVLDTDSDPAHNRTVFTLTGAADALRDSLASLAASADGMIDLTRQEGAHPRVGTLDVCPLVPHEAPMEEAVTTAREVGKRIADELALPVYLYGAAATREEKRALPDIRRAAWPR